MKLPKQIVIWDTEYTSWEGSQERDFSGPNEHREIVQIAAIKIDTNKLVEIDSFTVMVKPKINPVLSDYFINLTKISQQDVDNSGVDFHTALKQFIEFVDNTHCYSFGGDEKEINENCILNDIEYPFDEKDFFDIRNYFIENGVDATKFSSGTITEAFGVRSAYRAHEAFNDCRTILEGLRLLKQKLSKE